MSLGDLTPDTVFRPLTSIGDTPLFNFGSAAPHACEQAQYKQLINAELARQGVLCAHLADRMGIQRPKLHKILKQTKPLSDSLRDDIFDQLGIDHVRAKFCVSLLRDHRAYVEQSVFLTCESLKSFYLEVVTCRRGSIEVELRPAIIHEAARRAYDLLLSHQERVIQNDRTLQA